MAIALHHSRATGTAKLILIGIANHDGDGGAWPSLRTLARYAGITDTRRIRRAIGTLENLGEIRREVMGGGTADTPSHLRPNLYHFKLTCPSTCDHSKNHKRRDEATLIDDPDPRVVRPPEGRETPTPRVVRPPEPSFNSTTDLKEETQVNAHARNKEECPKGHPLIADHCVYACRADLERREAEALKLAGMPS